MSGIVGVCYLNQRPVEQQNIARMVDTLAHRGPDGADIWVDGSVGLGHRMLWTTPESIIEKLPLVNPSKDIVLTSDCRIDNREELIAALQLNNSSPEQITDSDLILGAYEKWGEECPEHLLGDFVFAIWDKRKQTLFCARDHMGVKPFYYYHQPGKIFAFASEIKALFCLQDIPRQLNAKRISDSLTTRVDHTHTFYRNIFRLPPAHSMTIGGEDRSSQQYWFLDPKRELHLDSDEEYAAEFRRIFTEAVRCRLRSAFPIGSHLSGGLDSSSITCVARDLLTQTNKPPLHTFSNIFDDVPQCDERVFINAVLGEGNLIPHFIYADKLGPLTLLDEIFQHEEEGFFDPNHRLVWGLNQAAQQENVRIVLNGFDGDTTVSHGLLYLTELASAGKWADFADEAQAIERNLNRPVKFSLFSEHGLPYLRKLVRQGKWIEFTKQALEINKHFGISPVQLFLKYGLKSLIPEWLYSAKQRLRGKKQDSLSIEQLFDSKFAEYIDLKESIKTRNKLNLNQPQTVRIDQCKMLTSGLMAFSLELIDRTAAVFSQEARHPFMDKRLIEFCVALPPQQKLNQGWNRMVMRRAMNNILPKKVQWRPDKTNMSQNFIHGLLFRDKKRLDELVLNNSEQIDKYVNINTLRMAYEQWNSTGKVKSDDALVVWKTVTIALWIHHNGLSLNNTSEKEVIKKQTKKFATSRQ